MIVAAASFIKRQASYLYEIQGRNDDTDVRGMVIGINQRAP